MLTGKVYKQKQRHNLNIPVNFLLINHFLFIKYPSKCTNRKISDKLTYLKVEDLMNILINFYLPAFYLSDDADAPLPIL